MSGVYPIVMDYIASGDTTIGQGFAHPTPMRTTPSATKSGTWVVNNVNQPTIGTTTADGYNIQAATSAAGFGFAYPDTGAVIMDADL